MSLSNYCNSLVVRINMYTRHPAGPQERVQEDPPRRTVADETTAAPPFHPYVSEMIPGSVLISDAVFLELVDALNQYSDEEEEGHNDTSDGKQDDSKEDLPVTRKRKRHAMEGKQHCFLVPLQRDGGRWGGEHREVSCWHWLAYSEERDR